MKNGNSHVVLQQESQENFSQVNTNIQKKVFKTAVPAEQKCALDITFESVSNLSDFNQRGGSTECNDHCSELYTGQMPTDTERTVEVEKDSLSPSMLNEPPIQPDQPDMPVTSFVSLDSEANDENLILSGKNTQLLSQDAPLTGKPSKSQFCENSNNITKVKTNSHGSESLDSCQTQNSKIETNSVSSVASQPLPDCQDNSPLQSKTSPGTVESLGLNVSEQIEIHLEESVPSDKQLSGGSASVDLNHMENKPETLESKNSQEPSSSVKDGDTIFLSLGEHNSCEEVALVPQEDNPVKNNHSLPSESGGSVGGSPETQSTDSKPSKDSVEVDASSIVSLKIIISDDPFVSSDAELNSAVSSISGENLPTIILSSKSPAKNAEFVTCLSSEETTSAVVSVEVGDSGSMEQNLVVLKPEEPVVNNPQSEDGITFSTSVAPCVPKDGGYIQLMPATSTAFGNSSNILIATCVTDPTALGPTVSQSNVMVLPGNSAPMTTQPPQQLQTPPKSNSVFAVNQAVSPNFSQGNSKSILEVSWGYSGGKALV